MSHTCEVFFLGVSRGTIEIHQGEYPENAAKYMMLQTGITSCSHITVVCEELNLKYEIYEAYFDNNGHFIRTIYGHNLKYPYNQSDGLNVWNNRRMECDHKATLKHHTCFRPFYDYQYDNRGIPIAAFCEKHHPMNKKEQGLHETKISIN